MVFEEPQATQVQIKGMKLKNLFDKNFVNIIEKEFEDSRFIYMRIAIEKEEANKRRRSVFIGHYRPEHEENDIIVVDADTPEDIKKIISILKRYDEGC